jgi:hypothetical protein
LLFKQFFPCFDFHTQVHHRAVAFGAVAQTAKQLVVFVLIATTFGFWYDMVDFEVFQTEGFSASVA